MAAICRQVHLFKYDEEEMGERGTSCGIGLCVLNVTKAFTSLPRSTTVMAQMTMPTATSPRKTRASCDRYGCVRENSKNWVQVRRQAPVMVNIMRDIPRVDTQKVAHCRLLLN
ncbi:unnamed protein product, partial [Ascophyllum nodosum]